MRVLENPNAKTWKGDRPALTVVYAGSDYEAKPNMQHYAIKTDRYRHISYNNGKEELYDHQNDPNEWNNLVFSENRANELLKKPPPTNGPNDSPIELNGLKEINEVFKNILLPILLLIAQLELPRRKFP